MYCISKKRSKITKKILSAAVAGVLCFNLTSCNFKIPPETLKNDKVVIVFSWWGDSLRNSSYNNSTDIFCEENPNIVVQKKSCDYNNYRNKIRADLDMDRTADVMTLDYDTFYENLETSDNFLNLDDSKEIDFSNFNASDLYMGKVNSNLKGIPAALTTLNFFYNKDLYVQYGLKLPQTWNDLFEAAKIFSINEIYPVSFTEEGFWHACNAYNEQLTGHSIYDKNSNFVGTVEDFETMLDFYLRLINEKVSKPAADFSVSDIEKSKTAGVAAWVTDTEKYCSAAEKKGINIQTGNMPTTENYEKFGWYKKATCFYCIKKSTSHPTESAKFLNYILNSEDAAVNQGLEQGLPISKSALETLAANDMLTGTAYQASLQMNVDNRLTTMSPKLDSKKNVETFTKACNMVLYNQNSTKEAADFLMEQIKK